MLRILTRLAYFTDGSLAILLVFFGSGYNVIAGAQDAAALPIVIFSLPCAILLFYTAWLNSNKLWILCFLQAFSVLSLWRNLDLGYVPRVAKIYGWHGFLVSLGDTSEIWRLVVSYAGILFVFMNLYFIYQAAIGRVRARRLR